MTTQQRWVLLLGASLAFGGCSGTQSSDNGEDGPRRPDAPDASTDAATPSVTPTEAVDGSQEPEHDPEAGSEPAEPETVADGGVPNERCELVDGTLAYGKIGEPIPLPLRTGAAECEACTVQDIAGFRTAAGYGFVWSTSYNSTEPEPNLYSMSVDVNFEGGEPRALLVDDTVVDLDLRLAPDGFVLATCLRGPAETSWTWLNDDLDARNVVGSGLPCGLLAHPLLSTGEGYLTAFEDTRGVVVGLLDEAGVVLTEQIIAAGSDLTDWLYFSKSEDRALVVFGQPSAQTSYGVIDSQGALVRDVQTMGEERTGLGDFAIAASGDGWQLVSPGLNGERGVQLTVISRDGLVQREQLLFPNNDFNPNAFTPSASGGLLLVGSMTEAVRFAHSFTQVLRIDDAGEVMYRTEMESSDSGYWLSGVVLDPVRDLVVERHVIDGSDTYMVQEYGCLD